MDTVYGEKDVQKKGFFVNMSGGILFAQEKNPLPSENVTVYPFPAGIQILLFCKNTLCFMDKIQER